MALPESDIAEHEQNDDHGSHKPDDVVHDALLKFDSPVNSRATRVSRSTGEMACGIWRSVTTRTCYVTPVTDCPRMRASRERPGNRWCAQGAMLRSHLRQGKSVRCRTHMSCRADDINSLVAESLQPPIAHTLSYSGRHRTPDTCTDTSDRQSPGQVAPMSGDRNLLRTCAVAASICRSSPRV